MVLKHGNLTIKALVQIVSLVLAMVPMEWEVG